MMMFESLSQLVRVRTCVCVGEETCQLLKNKHDAMFHLIYNLYLLVHKHKFNFMGSNIYTTEKRSAVICIVIHHTP